MGYLTRNNLLAHPFRRALLDAIRDRPGSAFLDLFAQFKPDPTFGPALGFGNLAHHLHKMERAGMLTSRRSGRHRRYYQNGGPQGGETTALAVLQAQPARDVLDLLLAAPGSSQMALWLQRRALRPCSRQSVGYQLRRLELFELVISTRRAHCKAYFATELAARLRKIAGGAVFQAPPTSPGESALALDVAVVA